MKKIIKLFVVMVISVGVLSGCSTKKHVYSDKENEIIKEAIQMVSSKYDVEINEDDFSYSVGQQISENEFVSLDSKEKQESAYENVVSVTALKSSLYEKGEVYEFTVTFNSKTKEIMNISVSKG